MSFFEELKRRNVFRVAAAYAVAGWLLVQVADIFVPALHLPEWITTALAFFLLIGFPIAMFFAWAFEITPEGIKRESEVDHSALITRETAARLDRMTIGLLILVLVVVVLDRTVLHRGPEPTSTVIAEQAAPQDTFEVAATGPEDNRTSVAVLPFVNMSDDADNEYFSDGISEELLNVLVRIDSLRVPSRTSSFTFKGSKLKLSDIGHELGVDHVLEGSVRKSGDRIRVTAQLIDVRTDTHLWSETYTRELDDIFAVQDEISTAIVDALKLTLTGKDQQQLADHGTVNVEAYNNYLLGRHIWNRRTVTALAEAVGPLKKAVEIDPGFERAWSALADTYVLSPEYGVGPIDTFVPLANEATEKALSLNPDSARALTARGYVKAMFEYDIPGAIEDYQRAIELEPRYATAHQWYGETLAVARRLDDALAQVDIAIELDPLAPVIRHVKGWLLTGGKRYEEALKAFMEVFEVDPNYVHTHFNLIGLYVHLGEFDLARQESMKTLEFYDYDNSTTLAWIDAMENPQDETLKQIAVDHLEKAPDFYPRGADGISGSLMLLGEKELAFDTLERAFEAGDPYAIHMNQYDDIYGPVRDHPRFRALLERMNLLECCT